MNKKALGIDYGTKRIGVAVSHVGTGIAFPKEVIANDSKAISKLKTLLSEEVDVIVIGRSVNKNGTENEIMKEVYNFAERLKDIVGEKEICFQTEQFSSFEAERYLGKKNSDDSAAAAIILQRWLEANRIN